MAEQALSSREAFRAFLALIDEVDRDFLSEERRVTDPADIAEGEHMLLHLVKAAIDVWVDPASGALTVAVLDDRCAPIGPDEPRVEPPAEPLELWRFDLAGAVLVDAVKGAAELGLLEVALLGLPALDHVDLVHLGRAHHLLVPAERPRSPF